MKALVIGGGLFGCCAAIALSEAGYVTEIAEREPEIMQEASRVNHNRLHLGYHYLRSIATAEQSIEGLLSFLFNFGESVLYQFPNYYAIAKEDSKTSPEQFLDFCNRVGISYDEQFPSSHLLDTTKLEASFKVPEPVFDFGILKNTVGARLNKQKITLRFNSLVSQLLFNGKSYKASINGKEEEYDVVVNATYKDFNRINTTLGIPRKKLLYEDVVIPEFGFKSEPFGLTVMDGLFCSVMPKGKTSNTFLLYHVKNSVLQQNLTDDFKGFNYEIDSAQVEAIFRQSAHFMPFITTVDKMGYKRVTRVVFENSDDARLSELHLYPDFPNYFAILSGKISTCMQVALEIKHIVQHKQTHKKFKI